MIAAEGEQKSSKALKEAADIIAMSPAALQLRYLQVCKIEIIIVIIGKVYFLEYKSVAMKQKSF